MMIAMGLFWLTLVLGTVWLVRNSVERGQPETPSENPLTILDRRFAEGAVSLDEYKQRRDVLTGAAAPSPEAVAPPGEQRKDKGMKRLAFAMAVAGGPVFALRRLVPKLPAMRAHCHGIAVTGGGIPI